MERSPHQLVYTLTMSGEFRIHRAGCRDIKRDAQALSAAGDPLEARTAEGVALELHSDFIESGEMAPEEAEQYCEFLPCCEFQHVEEDAAKNLEEVVDADAKARYDVVTGKNQPEGVTMNRSEMAAAKTTDLRKVAREMGIKVLENGTKVNAGRKADLLVAINAKLDADNKAEQERVAEEQARISEQTRQAASKAKGKKAPKNTRKASGDQEADGTLTIRTARKFVAEAEAKGWSVKIDNQMATEDGDIVVITAEKGDESITLRWIDAKYDYYNGGSYHTDAKGKSRKILNASAAISRYL